MHDQFHESARAIGRRHLASGGRFTGSVLVLAEVYTLIMYRGGPGRARRFLDAVLQDAAYTWEPVTPELAARASAEWLGRFADQPFSLTDAVSFTLMRARRIATAFAYDNHFRTAGFTLLH